MTCCGQLYCSLKQTDCTKDLKKERITQLETVWELSSAQENQGN